MDSTALTYSIPKYYIESMCSEKISVKTAIKVEIDYQWFKTECTVFLVPDDENSSLRAFFSYYSRTLDRRDTRSSCFHGAVYLYNSQKKSLLGDKGYCLSYKPKGYHDLGATGSIRFTKSIIRSNLKTTIRVVKCLFKNETCPNGTLDCGPNDFCIANSLECDSVRDCPSGLDERDHCPDTTNYFDVLYRYTPLALVVVIATYCCLCAPGRTKSEPKNVYVPPEGGEVDGAHISNSGTAQLGYVIRQAPPDGNPVQGNSVPNCSPPLGSAQPANIDHQTSSAGVQAPQSP